MIGVNSESNTPLLLLVDDDPQAIRLLASLLRGIGRVQFATNGIDALAQASASRPDLVLLDAEMPGMDGFATCKELRGLPGCGELPILFVTAHADYETESRVFALGAVDFIRKPFSPQVVQARVRIQLALKRRTDEVRRVNMELEGRVAARTAELSHALERAQAADVAKNEFLSNMTHELRTPMHGILGFCSLGLKATRDAPGQERLHRYFQNIRTSGERMHGLVSNLLDLTMLSVGQATFEFVPSDIRELCTRALDSFRSKAEAKNLVLELRAPSEMPLQCDARRVSQVLNNVLENAVMFSPPGGRIQMELSVEDDFLVLRVSDEGPGVPEDERKAIFGRFVEGSRTKTRAGGRGLGLAICRVIVSAHGGDISMHEAVELGGAMIVMRLPRAGYFAVEPEQLGAHI